MHHQLKRRVCPRRQRRALHPKTLRKLQAPWRLLQGVAHVQVEASVTQPEKLYSHVTNRCAVSSAFSWLDTVSGFACAEGRSSRFRRSAPQELLVRRQPRRHVKRAAQGGRLFPTRGVVVASRPATASRSFSISTCGGTPPLGRPSRPSKCCPRPVRPLGRQRRAVRGTGGRAGDPTARLVSTARRRTAGASRGSMHPVTGEQAGLKRAVPLQRLHV